MTSLRIDSERLDARIAAIGEIDATPGGGSNRQALTDGDKAARELFASWCQAAGCTLRVDELGNMFARREGAEPDLPPVMAGSHLDTQPTGGRYDGVYGVLAGLEVIETLNAQGIQTRHPIEIVNWTNEEGARFSPAMIGSGVYAGVFQRDEAHARTDRDGRTLGAELERIGYRGKTPCQATPIKAAFEVHIEQGPILEAAALPIGVVGGAQGIRWYDLALTGSSVHAGPTPMDRRRDPVKSAQKIMGELYAMAAEIGPDSRLTFGALSATPGARNTVPERVDLAVDLRHPDEAALQRMEDGLRAIAERVTGEDGTAWALRSEWASPAIRFDLDCVAAVRQAAELCELPYLEMTSGAGHDTVYLSRVAPVAMIFIPCKDGISHNEAEFAKSEDIEAGANVLLHAILTMAERV